MHTLHFCPIKQLSQGTSQIRVVAGCTKKRNGRDRLRWQQYAKKKELPYAEEKSPESFRTLFNNSRLMKYVDKGIIRS